MGRASQSRESRYFLPCWECLLSEGSGPPSIKSPSGKLVPFAPVLAGKAMIAASKQTRQPVVLIVDDQKWWSRSLESVLVLDAYRVIRARSPQALDTARAHNPDLLVINGKLPNGDGIGLCRIVRNDPRFGAGVPILMTTPDPYQKAASRRPASGSVGILFLSLRPGGPLAQAPVVLAQARFNLGTTRPPRVTK